MMSCVMLLVPALQRFDWGSTDAIPTLLGFEPDGAPYAEAWWGAHPVAPSTTERGPLDDVIAADPLATLGAPCEETHGRLPYLLKVLAIAQPLSIQVHPTLERAREGFEQEQAAGLAINDPHRTYKDASHKPEMLLALSEVTVLSGFRDADAVAADLRAIGGDDARGLAALIEERGIHAYIDEVLTESHPDAVAHVSQAPDGISASATVARDALAIHPDDPGALVALAMNAVTLQPGETLFTPSGVVHCYISGLCVELMANSDNVVRAGFTHKPVNADLLRDLALLEHTQPLVPDTRLDGAARVLSTDADEFELTVVENGQATCADGPRIVVALDGVTRVAASGETLTLDAGAAAFIPAADGEATLDVTGMAVVASVATRSH